MVVATAVSASDTGGGRATMKGWRTAQSGSAKDALRFRRVPPRSAGPSRARSLPDPSPTERRRTVSDAAQWIRKKRQSQLQRELLPAAAKVRGQPARERVDLDVPADAILARAFSQYPPSLHSTGCADASFRADRQCLQQILRRLLQVAGAHFFLSFFFFSFCQSPPPS